MARKEEQPKGDFDSLPLFGRKLSAKLESRILEYLDLRSLAGCRTVNRQWQAAVDKLNYFWLLFNQRLGIADACEMGREKLRAEKMLGDCWITCSFCPVVRNPSSVERDMKLVSVQRFFYGVREKNFLRVTVFGKESATLYSWRLQLPNTYIREGSSERDICIPEDWIFLLYVRGRYVDNDKETTGTSEDVGIPASDNHLDDEAASIDSKDSLASQEANMQYAIGSFLFAILPISQIFPGSDMTQVSPIAMIDLPNPEAVSRCLIHNAVVLLLTQGSIVLYRLPEPKPSDQVVNQPPIILTPHSTIDFKISKPFLKISGFSLQPVPCSLSISSTSGSDNLAKFLIYLTAKSELEYVLRIDQLVLNYTDLHTEYSVGELIADSIAFLYSRGIDHCHVFLFIVNATLSRVKKTAQSESAKICKILRLVRYVPVKSGEIQSTYDSCDYENPFDFNYSHCELPLRATSINVGLKFWYGLGYTKPDKEPRIVIFRIGYPNALAQISMSSLMIWDFMTSSKNRGVEQSVILNAASWIDSGFEPDNPEETPLISIWGSNEMHLLLNWRCYPERTPAPVLSALVRLTNGGQV